MKRKRSPFLSHHLSWPARPDILAVCLSVRGPLVSVETDADVVPLLPFIAMIQLKIFIEIINIAVPVAIVL